jgi:iron complex transport system ATP-binding protein
LMVLDLMRRETRRGAAVVLTLHDLGHAARACDRLVVVHGGRTVAEGEPRDVLQPWLLRDVFGLEGELVDDPSGLHLHIRRADPSRVNS